jgi:hypothetical protein
MFKFLNMKIQMIKFVAKHQLPFKKTLCQQILCKGRKDLDVEINSRFRISNSRFLVSDF